MLRRELHLPCNSSNDSAIFCRLRDQDEEVIEVRVIRKVFDVHLNARARYGDGDVPVAGDQSRLDRVDPVAVHLHLFMVIERGVFLERDRPAFARFRNVRTNRHELKNVVALAVVAVNGALDIPVRVHLAPNLEGLIVIARFGKEAVVCEYRCTSPGWLSDQPIGTGG